MSDKLQAARDLKFLATKLAGIVALQSDLEKLGQAEQIVEDLTAQSVALQEKKVGLEAAVATLSKQLADLQKAYEPQVKKIISDARLKEQEIVRNAEERAALIVQDGKKQRVQMLDEAAKEVERIVKAGEEKQQELKRLEMATAEQEGRLLTLKRKIEETKQEIGAL